MTQKLTFKIGFSLALVAVLGLGLAVTTAQPANAWPAPGNGTCPMLACSGSGLSLLPSNCEIILPHCEGVCSVYIDNSTGEQCYDNCQWY